MVPGMIGFMRISNLRVNNCMPKPVSKNGYISEQIYEAVPLE